MKKSKSSGAMLVYAMVFTMVAAAIFYAAAAIWQARQSSDMIRDYGQQRWLTDWSIKNSIRSSYQYSLDHGWGLPTINEAAPLNGSSTNPFSAWWFYNGSVGTDAYFYTAAAGNSGESALSTLAPNPVPYLDFYDAGGSFSTTLYPSGNLWTLDASPNTVTAHDSILGTIPAPLAIPAPAGTYQLTPSSLFLIPGYRARDTNNSDHTASESEYTYGSGGTLPAPFHSSACEKSLGEADKADVLSHTGGNLPPAIVFRSDLPFCIAYGATGESQAPFGPNGLFRWTREGVQYTLKPSAGAIPGSGQVADPITKITNYVYSVEEPITNYQLLLLAPTNLWTLTHAGTNAGQYGTINFDYSTDQPTAGGLAYTNIPRMLVWGNIDSSFTGITGNANIALPANSGNNFNCLAALVGQDPTKNLLSNSSALSASGITWCPAKPSTRISFGRGNPNSIVTASAVNPNQKAATDADLPTFLTSTVVDNMTIHTTAGNPDVYDLSDEKQLNVINAQGLAQPILGSTPATASVANYVNPVLSISSQGVLQWSQQSTSGGIMDSTTLQYTTAGSDGGNLANMDQWASASTKGVPPNNLNLALDAPALTHYRLYGLSGIHSYDHTNALSPKDATEITIDLATFADIKSDGTTMDSFNGTGSSGKNAATASVPGSGTSNPWQAPWLSPREIHIYGDKSVFNNANQTLVVRIIGDTQAAHINAGLLPPIKIVIDDPNHAIATCDIRFIADTDGSNAISTADRAAVKADRLAATASPPSGLNSPASSSLTSPPPANYRRFILQTNVMQTNVSNSYVSFESGNSGLHWYGVIIAPNGLLLGHSGTETVSKGLENCAALAAGFTTISATWHGTILACKSIDMGNPSAATGSAVGVLKLNLMPDDGSGTIGSKGITTYQGTSLDINSCYYLFTPGYFDTPVSPLSTVQNTPLGRPVPILVPRLVWNFEDETSRVQ